MEYIERDQCEYTLDDEDRRVQDVILKPDPDATVLKKTLSCSYPNLPFNEAIQKENEKLQLELQRSQACMDVGQCEVIQHLLDFTESVAVTSLSQKNSSPRNSKNVDHSYSDVNSDKESSYDESYTKKSGTKSTSRFVFLSLCLWCVTVYASIIFPSNTFVPMCQMTYIVYQHVLVSNDLY